MSETPKTLSDKLAAVRYQAPAVRPVCQTINCGQPIMQGSSRCEDCAGGIDDLTRYLQLQENLAKAKAMRPSLRARLSDAWDFFRVIIWPRISHAAIGLVIIVITALVLIVGCAVTAKGADAADARWVMAEVTAYCPCAVCCGTNDRTTANNTSTDAVPYAFAADRSLPFGARVYVPHGLGVLDVVRATDRWFIVDDRGGALDTEARRYDILRLDLRVREHWWATRFGRRLIPVYVSAGRP